jgi:hypothetical protein
MSAVHNARVGASAALLSFLLRNLFSSQGLRMYLQEAVVSHHDRELV